MHRKALHTTRALSLSFGVLALGLTLGLAGHSPQADADGAALASSVPAAATETTDDPATVSQRLRRKQARDAMAVPFFSFAQVLRRGNGG